MQPQCVLQTDVEDSATKVWPSCQKVIVLLLMGLTTYSYIHRNTVQMFMSLIDPQGARRKPYHMALPYIAASMGKHAQFV